MRYAVVLAQRVEARLTQDGWTLAVAESCTGGLLGATLTRVPGSSACFSGGVIAYANALKVQLLGVDAELLERYGAVSAAVAEAMAQGVRRLCGTNLGLSVTGIAGPGGGTPQKPVGLTYIGLAAAGGCWSWEHRWQGTRYANQVASVTAALEHLLAYLEAGNWPR